ncbi:MAG TPA: PilT/PilU family type 4a pilus ATPase [Candidatus Eisenbacteria bacterium]|jgi:twitching motility protein PilT|nr:PilT/PilU family type 4a pilus ATPase [Candidatus Eisenbacteria bacterium]
MPRIDAFLQLAREQGCSDIHFTVGLPPLVRLDGDLTQLKYRPLSEEEIGQLLTEILPADLAQRLDREGSVDLSYAHPGLGRFRFNLFRQRRGLGAICRVVPNKLPSLRELGLPPVVTHLSTLSSGLVLITGGPGTGKTTTLAALIREINESRNLSIVTLEDPVEFLHESDKSLVVQRQVGAQVRSFQEGVRSALRQDPDVILIGEMRDAETIAAAIEASETGHLVFATLHTRGAHQTLHRIVDTFPTEAQAQIRHTLGDNLRAIVSQDLVRNADGRGRRAVAEVLIMTTAIAQMIREGKTHQIHSAISTGRRVGMQLMDQALLTLVQSGDIDPNEAFLKAADKKDFIFYVTRSDLLQALEAAPAGGQAAEAA